MNFGENNMFCLNNQTKEEHENNIDVNLWYSSWEATTTTTTSIPITSSNSSFNNTTTEAERYSSGGHNRQQQQLYGGEECHVQGDPHLTCLHLGKRHYFEDSIVTTNGDDVNNNKLMGNRHVCGDGAGYVWEGEDKRARGYCYEGSGGGKTAAYGMVPRCQVEGCHVGLMNAKEYHRRHRVCDMHSKAPKVVVLGLDQRFCQQCSRFHVVSEFDDSKRSCRRRLAGHNERRRKSSHLSVSRTSRQEGFALSLLSSSGSESWLCDHVDLSTRCSAALRELIAENRAALITRQHHHHQHHHQQQQQLVYDRDLHVVTHHAAAVEEQDFEELQPHSNYFLQQLKKDHSKLFVKKEELSLDAVKQYTVHCPDELAKIHVVKDYLFELGENVGHIYSG